MERQTSGKRVTSQQVADHAGVSRTTVSLVLNEVESASISAETRKRVLQAAEELQYVPNESARSLVSGQTRTIALIICQATHQIMSDGYLPSVMHGMNQVARRYGFRVLVDWIEDVSQPDAYINLAKAKKIDGILLACPRLDDDQLAHLVDDGYPIVLMGHVPGIKAYSVEIDDVLAASQVVQHLIDLGHERIGMVTNCSSAYSNTVGRVQGYRQALENAGIPIHEDLIQYGDFDPASGYQATEALLMSDERPSAIFVASDVVAVGALAAIRDHGLCIPEDIAVASMDDIPMARYLTPALTSMRVPAVLNGYYASEMLVDLIQGREPENNHILMETELIIRQSCGARSGTVNVID